MFRIQSQIAQEYAHPVSSLTDGNQQIFHIPCEGSLALKVHSSSTFPISNNQTRVLSEAHPSTCSRFYVSSWS